MNKELFTRESTGLTHLQFRFAEEYVLDPSSIMNAAIRAGYSPDNADQLGSRQFHNPKVRAVIDQMTAESAKQSGITRQRVLAEIAKIAFANLQDVIDQDEDGNTTVDIKKLPRDVASALSELSVVTTKGKNASRSIKVKQIDKLNALISLAKHLGLMNEKVEVQGKLSLEQLVNSSMSKEVTEKDESKESED